MKTDHDLRREFIDWFVQWLGGDPALNAALVEMARRDFRATGPAEEIDEATYAQQLAKLKAEAPAYLHYIRHQHPGGFPEN